LKSLIFYRPHKDFRCNHIDAIFHETINWELIETHLLDMLRVALSIKAGKISAAAILRRLGTSSKKDKLYFAFRELGRVIRTIFLLKYISNSTMRRFIQAATCKSEAFNYFLQWAMFGNNGVIRENSREEQSKMIKYNHLVANLIILYNIQEMTKVINELIGEGYDITPEILSQLSPYRTEHINRFGAYLLNLARELGNCEFELRLKNKLVKTEVATKRPAPIVELID